MVYESVDENGLERITPVAEWTLENLEHETTLNVSINCAE